MKRILFISLIAILISPGPVSAVLTVEEYIPGEKVTYDNVTGKYWYWNLPDFVNMTYSEQITEIAGLGTYGNIAGGWHMADLDEMESLWANGEPKVALHFAPVWVGEPTPLEPDPGKYWYGRYDHDWGPYPGPPSGRHGYALIAYSSLIGYYSYFLDATSTYEDEYTGEHLGAWVTTDPHVIPLPGAVVLAASGLLSMLGLNRWRRKR